MATSGARRRPLKYPEELRERAVRMVLEVRRETGEKQGTVTRIAKQLGIGAESLRGWVNQAEVDTGRGPGASSADGQRVAELEREVRELRRANDMRSPTRCPQCCRWRNGAGTAPEWSPVSTPGVFSLLHDARLVLVNLERPGRFDIAQGANRLRMVEATYDGVRELPVVGEVVAPSAVLLRPDGHVAWAGDVTDQELPERSRRGSEKPPRPSRTAPTNSHGALPARLVRRGPARSYVYQEHHRAASPLVVPGIAPAAPRRTSGGQMAAGGCPGRSGRQRMFGAPGSH